MGPARFHCATLLLTEIYYMPLLGPCVATRGSIDQYTLLQLTAMGLDYNEPPVDFVWS